MTRSNSVTDLAALLLGVGALIVFLAVIVALPVALLFPQLQLHDNPGANCPVYYDQGRFTAPKNVWVRIAITGHAAVDSELPAVISTAAPSMEVDLSARRVPWTVVESPAGRSIDHLLLPGMWIEVADLPRALTYDQFSERRLAVTDYAGKPKVEIAWVCATPVVSIGSLIEMIGIALAVLEITGMVPRFEALLDAQRVRLGRWLFPWRKQPGGTQTQDMFEDTQTQNQGLPIFGILLTLAYLVAFVTSFDMGAWWQIALWFIGAAIAGFVTDLVIKWILGCGVLLLWLFLDKAPNGTVGGIGFALVLYGLGTNYAWVFAFE